MKLYIGLTDLPAFFDYCSPFRFKLNDTTIKKQLQNKVMIDEELEKINMITKDIFQYKNNLQVGQERLYWIPLKTCDTE